MRYFGEFPPDPPKQHGPVQRQRYYAEDIAAGTRKYDGDAYRWPVLTDEEANLLSSRLEGNPEAGDGRPVLHAPTLDVDHKVTLLESETPGHYHLLIDVPMPWEDYVDLLTVLARVGIIEPGYASASISRGASYVATKPWKQAA